MIEAWQVIHAENGINPVCQLLILIKSKIVIRISQLRVHTKYATSNYCLEHTAWDGLVLPKDDPFWNQQYLYTKQVPYIND
ncbi:MAG: hypothetical protein ACRC5H_01415 [Treponemataceae bacterium]